MWSEFKAYLLKTNALALAIAVILGTTLGAVVNSLVNDIIMPPVGLLLGKVDFSRLYINLSDAKYATLDEARKAGAATLNYGFFANTVITFIVVALVVFMVERMVVREKPTPVPARKDCPFCGMNILAVAKRCPHCTSQL